MIRFTFLILITLSLIISSCESRRSKLDRKNLIPEKELVSILTDIYITDGLLGMPRIVMKYSPLDSISTYNHVIEKHGYTKEIMDKTMKYYFIKNPKKLIKIYDKVLGILSEMESRVQKEIAQIKSRYRITSGRVMSHIPSLILQELILLFLIFLLQKPGSYTLTATVTLFPMISHLIRD